MIRLDQVTPSDQVDTVNTPLCLKTKSVESDLVLKTNNSWNYSSVFEGFAMPASTTILVLFLLQHRLTAKRNITAKANPFHKYKCYEEHSEDDSST